MTEQKPQLCLSLYCSYCIILTPPAQHSIPGRLRNVVSNYNIKQRANSFLGK